MPEKHQQRFSLAEFQISYNTNIYPSMNLPTVHWCCWPGNKQEWHLACKNSCSINYHAFWSRWPFKSWLNLW